jgi:hypothetical protein
VCPLRRTQSFRKSPFSTVIQEKWLHHLVSKDCPKN